MSNLRQVFDFNWDLGVRFFEMNSASEWRVFWDFDAAYIISMGVATAGGQFRETDLVSGGRVFWDFDAAYIVSVGVASALRACEMNQAFGARVLGDFDAAYIVNMCVSCMMSVWQFR